MLKKTLLFVLSFFVATGLALAEVDVNKADQAALDGVRGIGPSMSRRILDERQKGGSFKDWSDLQARVKGIKDKAAAKLSANGLTVNGQPKSGAPGDAAARSGKAAKSPRAENKGKEPAAKADKMAEEPVAAKK